MKYAIAALALAFVLGTIFHKALWIEYRLTQEEELNRFNEAVQPSVGSVAASL